MFLEHLVSIASGPTSIVAPQREVTTPAEPQGGRTEELFGLLSSKNGFYAFESALHVLPWTDTESSIGVFTWNEESLWRDRYQTLVSGLFFFAEDAFGGQFAIRREEVVTFDPESGETEHLAASLEEWAEKMLSNFPLLTGHPVARAWQMVHGPIPARKRLLPKIPFVLGGEYSEANLFAVDAVEGMRYRGDLWQQIRDLPDGAQVRLKALPPQ